MEVLIEKSDIESSGHTGNYIMVKVNEKLCHNKIYSILIKERIDNYLKGEVK